MTASATHTTDLGWSLSHRSLREPTWSHHICSSGKVAHQGSVGGAGASAHERAQTREMHLHHRDVDRRPFRHSRLVLGVAQRLGDELVEARSEPLFLPWG
jgi:hypothetical protein